MKSFQLVDGDLYIVLVNVQESGDFNNQFDGKLAFTNVNNIIIDDEKTDNMKILHTEGGILYLEVNNNHAELFVEWYDYKNHTEKGIPYEFNYENIIWQPTANHGASD